MQNPFPNPESNRPAGGYFRSPEGFSSDRGTAAQGSPVPNPGATAPYQAAQVPNQSPSVPYQTTPVPTPVQAHPAEAYTHSSASRKKGRRGSRRRSLWLYLFAGIGVIAVGFILVRYLIIPLLVVIG